MSVFRKIYAALQKKGVGAVGHVFLFGEGGRGKSKSPHSFVRVGRRQNTPSLSNLIFTFNHDRDVNILLLGHPGLLIVWFPMW